MPLLVTFALATVCIPAWIMVYCCLRKKGFDRFMLSGYLTVPKTDRAAYRAKFDVPAMNRYAGKMIFLPLAVLTTLKIPLQYIQAAWYSALIALGATVTVGLMFFAVPTLMGKKFEI